MLSPGADSIAAHAPPATPLELLVGPEGGLSERERELAVMKGCESVALGPRILRTETAPIVALAAVHALWGDFTG
jgi:16S rRNA (uracil1498-N3)-methyltransferase